MLKYSALLRAGEAVSDADFDSVYEWDVQAASPRHWTPVAIALRAAHLLTALGGATHVLDVGAGPGKFCIVGALSTSARFTGIEQQSTLVTAARAAARRFAAERAVVLHGNFLDVDSTEFDGFYLYNPFQADLQADLFSSRGEMKEAIARFGMYVTVTIATLIRAPPGAAVVTYHGFGGRMPRQYRPVYRERAGDGDLAMWIRAPYSRT